MTNDEKQQTNKLANLFLTLGILGAVATIFDLFALPSIAAMIIAIIIMTKGKELPFRKVAPILMIIVGILAIIYAIFATTNFIHMLSGVFSGNVEMLTSKHFTNSVANQNMLLTVLGYPLFALRVVGVVFAFIDYTKLKNQAAD